MSFREGDETLTDTYYGCAAQVIAARGLIPMGMEGRASTQGAQTDSGRCRACRCDRAAA
jgi:hypothetical protein